MANLPGATMALILVVGCAPMQAPAAPDAAAAQLAADAISFEISSWGSPMERFRIARDGTGEYGKAPEFRAPLRTHRFNAGPAGFARIRAALAGIERFTARAPACGSRATDFPYGQIVWHNGSNQVSISFDVGCQGAEMQRVVGAAHDAARLAEQFSQAGGAR